MIDFIKARENFLQATEGYDNQKWNDLTHNPFFIMAPPLSESHLKNCQLVESREKMLEKLPEAGIVAEVGTQYGNFAETILAVTKPKKLHLIDINLSPLKKELHEKKLLFKKIIDHTVELHEGNSSNVLEDFPDNYFDWIYIDADHSYEGVKSDINIGYTKVKEDGYLVFNDYTHWSIVELKPYGVPRAVNECCISHEWEMVFFALDNYLNYHDVAIRRIKNNRT